MSCRPLFAFALVLLSSTSSAFYLPGVAPQDFAAGEQISFKVNKLSSVKNLPYEYYSLPYCRPEKIISSAENLGEVLRGDRIENSLYQASFLYDDTCHVLCRIPELSKDQASSFQSRIKDQYKVNMILDNLPVGMVRMRRDGDQQVKTYERGFPVGVADSSGATYLNNHLRFTVLYHQDPETKLSRIVGFEVEPFSVAHTYDGQWKFSEIGDNGADVPTLKTCEPKVGTLVSGDEPKLEVREGQEVIFTYDVLFKASEIRWATRWDTYLLSTDDNVHWFSIVNSLTIVLFLSGMVAMIMLRTLRRDISQYNAIDDIEDAVEETGWKLVHGDVLRPPKMASWLAVCVGTGVQLLVMACATLTFALLGFLSPANRGSLLSAIVILFVFAGMFAGYASARLYKSFRGQAWRATSVRTALAYPGAVSAIFLVLNFMVWGQKSSGAIPFGTLVSLIFLWFGISVPLTFIGSYVGYRKPVAENPIRTNKIPRQIPEQPWYMHTALTILIGGVLPFGAVFIELFFILTSMWMHQVYYLFGFLALVFVILVVTCAEISVVLIYFQLCSEDYRWWWRSFLTSGSSALYLFVYSMFYFYSKLDITKIVPAMMYFGYQLIIALSFFCLTGTIGFYACRWFVRKIYGAVKID